MAEQQLCTFFLNGLFFGIDVQHVQEVIRPHALTPVPLAPADICGLINLRGQILTVIDLQQRLNMGKSAMRLPTKLINELPGFYIVVSIAEQVVSLLVDDVGDVLAFSANTFQPPPSTLKGKMRHFLAGAYPLSEGFLLVLDTEKILLFKNI
ncbi:chemotaxis protein CheW [Tolypothrix sp. FACHB-123]|uniref:chemotaxis protein CheW n=1 Tax=Tolypothrix sp. FACHB-123 TaxID=2692868 RepID=UPI00168960C1|nr:chemotaxis protein CheW [Tolypothrix sp. FACHB-123]MBD2353343.1 chemotaxis protein CheW [Tolypothrix sp. FACHB-123]